MAKLNVYNMKKEAVDTIELNDMVFGAEYNESLIHQVIVALHNNARQGTKSTLTRSEINASKKKIWRQKGTGNARHDEKSAPQFVGGGVVFAPKPRDFSQKVNKKMPGHYGHEAVTVQNLKVVRVDAERNLILVKGAIPGPKQAIVTIKSAAKA